MGAGQSKTEDTEKVYHNETPIQFSQDVINDFEDHQASAGVSVQRQTTLDAQISSRIKKDLNALREQEQVVLKEIEQALEKENLDRETSMAGEASEGEDDTTSGGVKTSAALLGDLQEIKDKVDKYQTRKELAEFPELRTKADALVACYKANPKTPLDCAPEVRAFKASVEEVEQKYVKTL